jgi:hypothetical protein
MNTAPSKVEIFVRFGKFGFSVGDGELHCGIGVTALYYQDPFTENLKGFNRSNLKALVDQQLIGSYKIQRYSSYLKIKMLKNIIRSLPRVRNTSKIWIQKSR